MATQHESRLQNLSLNKIALTLVKNILSKHQVNIRLKMIKLLNLEIC